MTSPDASTPAHPDSSPEGSQLGATDQSTGLRGQGSGATVAPRQVGRATQGLALFALVMMGVLWGSTFFSMKDLTTRLPVADLLAVRFQIAALALGVVAWRHWRMSRETLLQGIVLGLIYGTAQLVQTIGLAHTAASVSGFVTGLYVVVTPFLAAWLLRERIPGLTWVAVVLAAAGLGVLTLDLSAGVRMGYGETLTLLSAVMYACHIVAVDRWSRPGNSLSLTLVMLTVVALECTVFALPGGIQAPTGRTDWLWMLHIALVAGVVPILLQIWAQAVVESTTAAVLMASEPVWAAVFAVLFGGESVTWQMVLGGSSMFAAMILVTILPRLVERRSGRAFATASWQRAVGRLRVPCAPGAGHPVPPALRGTLPNLGRYAGRSAPCASSRPLGGEP